MAEHILPLPPKWEQDLECGWVTFESGKDLIRGYFAKPRDGNKLPAIVMAHERLGVIEHRQDVTRRFAKQGYACLSVDLYSRCDGQPPRNFKTLAERRILAQLATPDEQSVPDLQAGCDYPAARSDVDNTRIGAIGYCAGGGTLYGWICGKSKNVVVAVVYYGSTIARAEGRSDGRQIDRKDFAPLVQCPVQVHHGALDKTVTLDSAMEMVDRLKKGAHLIEFYIYENADHVFHDDTYPNYEPAAAERSWERTLEFFSRYLAK
jgi:carboxymethylenebutenolidase